eukprot:gnl/TRDRNA2_/TRDRNA2_174985_c0_seq3.p1 gnl/TRDRNA2_/TRDRNA2_174985_c0~~gnl/TRDRNA2_/TRDRNA2_174985_c0_seq3.p1  ORF type:complete len:207 (-),score=43.24 gnl/TRDRNA2_/TRDRNA2_174985_c0_seq3:28-648(-)
MMQDFPKALPPSASVGFTTFDLWCSYSPVKNDPKSALQKFKSGNHPQSGTTGEVDLFAANCRILRMAGATVEAAQKATFNGIEVDLEARVVWSPRWACSYIGVRRRLVAGGRLSISQRSTLVLDGDIVIENLDLDGSLVIIAQPGVSVRVANLTVRNEGWQLEPVNDDEQDEIARIRGFKIHKAAGRREVFEAPVNGDAVVIDESL